MLFARHLIRSRPRLSLSIAGGLIAAYLLPAHVGGVMRGLISWNVTIWTYLLLVGWLMMRSNHHRVRHVALQEDQTALAVLAIMSFGAVASIVAIVFELASVGKLPVQERLFHYLLTGFTVVGSWCMVATVFTFHYAVLFYKSPCNSRALRFPECELEPSYWDFVYFSFTLAVAVQTSDVSVMSGVARKAVLAQSVLFYFFNAAIVGLSINIAAGAVGS